MRHGVKIVFLTLCTLLFSLFVSAQDDRAQVPSYLHNIYFEVNIGYINYPFDARHLEDGFNFHSVKVPHTAVRLVLAGYQFNKYLSAQLSYMQPLLGVGYTYYIDNPDDLASRSLWLNITLLTLKPQLPLDDHFLLFGEAGLGIITRQGIIHDDGAQVITDANFASLLLGGGVKYQINDHWALKLGAIYVPEKKEVKQPPITNLSAGISYKLLPYTEEQLAETQSAGYIFPKHVIQIGYSINSLGYGVNNFLSEGKIPVFWGGAAEVASGFSIGYQRNIFHGARVFSLNWGANIGFWESNVNNDKFFTLSVFPMLRFNVLHTKPADYYFFYSVAGPTYISRKIIDDHDTGEHFTFEDQIGIGAFFGEMRKLNAEIRIGHYSNGNIFPENSGIKIPLWVNLGYSF